MTRGEGGTRPLEYTLENGLAREVELDDDGDIYRGARMQTRDTRMQGGSE